MGTYKTLDPAVLTPTPAVSRTRPRSSSSSSASLARATSSPESIMSASSLSLVASARSADSQPTTTSIFSTSYSPANLSSVLLDSTAQSSVASSPSPAARGKRSVSVSSTVAPTPSSTAASNKMDYLEYLYPAPERPPKYSTVKSSRGVRFPVYEREELASVPPPYAPAVYQLTLVVRKLEWLSPYEAAPSRGWKNLIMEINSTQLNFYSLDNIAILSRVKKSKTKKHYEFTPVEQEFIIDAILKSPAKYLSPSKLVRSYSLQHAKFGLPIDYKKKSTCLRLRCETEQFLTHFISLDEMILWSQYLSMGINVALDLDMREMPTDRIVPRRRRNRRNRTRAFSDSELIRRELAEPRHHRRASFAGESSGLKKKISKIFGRGRSNTVDMDDLARQLGELGNEAGSSLSGYGTSSSSPSPSASSSHIPTIVVNSSTPDASPCAHRRNDSVLSNDITTIREVDELDDDDDEEGEDIPDNEIHSIHELHDDDSDYESIQEETFGNYTMSQSTQDSLDEKWSPEPKKYTRRKFLKDSLRCIKLLSNEDCWVGKKLVRGSKLAKFDTCNKVESSKQPKNKFLEEYVVGTQHLLPAAIVAN